MQRRRRAERAGPLSVQGAGLPPQPPCHRPPSPAGRRPAQVAFRGAYTRRSHRPAITNRALRCKAARRCSQGWRLLRAGLLVTRRPAAASRSRRSAASHTPPSHADRRQRLAPAGAPPPLPPPLAGGRAGGGGGWVQLLCPRRSGTGCRRCGTWRQTHASAGESGPGLGMSPAGAAARARLRWLARPPAAGPAALGAVPSLPAPNAPPLLSHSTTLQGGLLCSAPLTPSIRLYGSAVGGPPCTQRATPATRPLCRVDYSAVHAYEARRAFLECIAAGRTSPRGQPAAPFGCLPASSWFGAHRHPRACRFQQRSGFRAGCSARPGASGQPGGSRRRLRMPNGRRRGERGPGGGGAARLRRG